MRRGAASGAASAGAALGLGAVFSGSLWGAVSGCAEPSPALAEIPLRLRAGALVAASAGSLLLEAATTSAAVGAGDSRGLAVLGLRLRVGAALAASPGPLLLEAATTSATTAACAAGALRAVFLAAGLIADGLGAAAAAFLAARLRAGAGASPLARCLRGAAALYLGWLAGQLLRAAWRPIPEVDLGTAAARDIAARVFWRRGFFCNVLNPKVALFFLAFLPQFIAADAGNKSLSFVLLGLIFNFNSLWVNLAYAWVGAAVSKQFTALQHGMRWLERVAGVMFLGFGLKLALADNPSN